MSEEPEMPDEIWATLFYKNEAIAVGEKKTGYTKYIRADLVPQWQPIETAPKNKRVLVMTDEEIYCAHWAKNPFTDDEAWIVAEWGEEGDQVLVKPVSWMKLPKHVMGMKT